MICLWTDSEVFYPLQFYELILLQLPVSWTGSEIHCLAFCVRNWFSNLPTPILSNLLLSHVFCHGLIQKSTVFCFMNWYWNLLPFPVVWPDSETICLVFYDLILKPSVSCFMTQFWNHLSPVLSFMNWFRNHICLLFYKLILKPLSLCFMNLFWNLPSLVLWTDTEIYHFMFYELILKSSNLSCFKKKLYFMNWFWNLLPCFLQSF